MFNSRGMLIGCANSSPVTGESDATTAAMRGAPTQLNHCSQDGNDLTRLSRFHFGFLVCVSMFLAVNAYSYPIQLLNGTATFSMCCGWTPSSAVDGNFVDVGWGIYPYTANQTAVWETSSELNPGTYTFKMYFFNGNPGHLLGRFRFSVTTDDRSTFADGLDTGGDVDANWIVLENPTIQGPAGMTFTVLPDNSILAGGTNPGTGIYIVKYTTNLSGVKGIRLEALEDPSLPDSGPGMFANGNFDLVELTLDAPTTVSPVTIDIKPGSSTNSINLGFGGTVPVAILSTSIFDAGTVDPLSVVLAGARVRLRGKGTPQSTIEDVNNDGRLDLVVHLTTEALELTESDSEAILTSRTYSGMPLEGSDTVRVVP